MPKLSIRGFSLTVWRKQPHHGEDTKRLQHAGGRALQNAGGHHAGEIRREAACKAGQRQRHQGAQKYPPKPKRSSSQEVGNTPSVIAAMKPVIAHCT